MADRGYTTVRHEPGMIRALVFVAVAGCFLLAVSVIVADIIVPDHDWISDTISDLGAGRYEYIVDIGIYSYSSALIAVALAAAHLHLGGRRWSMGLLGFALTGLIIFLVGARNEYGDGDHEGVVIHIYLVYALGLLFAAMPFAMAGAAARVGSGYARTLQAFGGLWAVSAPIFFIMPDGYDGIYERYLGLVSFAIVITMARLFGRVATETEAARAG